MGTTKLPRYLKREGAAGEDYVDTLGEILAQRVRDEGGGVYKVQDPNVPPFTVSEQDLLREFERPALERADLLPYTPAPLDRPRRSQIAERPTEAGLRGLSDEQLVTRFEAIRHDWDRTDEAFDALQELERRGLVAPLPPSDRFANRTTQQLEREFASMDDVNTPEAQDLLVELERRRSQSIMPTSYGDRVSNYTDQQCARCSKAAARLRTWTAPPASSCRDLLS